MDVQTLIMPIVVIAFGLFAGGMFVYRKMTAGETFSWEKFLPTMGIGALASFVLYLAAGALPSFDAVLAQIELMTPGGAPSITVILSALLVVWNTYMKGSGATTTTTSTPAAQATTTEQATALLPATAQPVTAWQPGFTVTPTFQRGVSPLPVTLQVQGGMDSAGKRTALQVDWMDGSPAEDFVLDPTTGQKGISHTFLYNAAGTKYDAHSFYPEFTLIGSDGAKVSFNVDGKGCEIECQSIIKA